MTRKLYQEDVHQMEFEGVVEEAEQRKDGCYVRLDQTAFYPEGGGQPSDTGWLNQLAVVDVQEEDGTIWHRLEGALSPGEAVHGMVNRERRLHFMQQHHGQHLLSATFTRFFEARTRSVHFGLETSTLDVDRLLTAEEVAKGEELANRAIWDNLKVEILFPSREEIEAHSRRTAPETDEPIRIIKIGNLDYAPCCGTHPSRTGEVGQIKILRHEPYKGGTRLTFVCGKAALTRFGEAWKVLLQLQKQLSTGERELSQRIAQLEEELLAAKGACAALQKRVSQSQGEQLLEKAKRIEDYQVIAAVLEEYPPEELRQILDFLTQEPKTIALLGCPTLKGGMLLFGCHKQEKRLSAKELLVPVLPLIQGKGGGNQVLAQGAGSINGLEEAVSAAVAAVEQALS